LKKYFQIALKEALKYKGRTLPNPAVGAVITKLENGKEIFICKEAHKKAGEKHAEVLAIEKAKKILNIPKKEPLGKYGNFRIYVTLEPCSTYGKTPPCALKISKEKIKEVYFLIWDVNPKNRKGSISIFEKENIKYFCYEEYVKNKKDKLLLEAYKLIDDFIVINKFNKPFFILKAALTLDGYIAKKDFSSKWITSLESRKLVHKLRKTVNAILIGKNTLIYDNPKLTIRHVKTDYQPKALIMINSLKNLDNFEKYYLFRERKKETTILTQNKEIEKIFLDQNIDVIFYKNKNELYQKLFEKQIYSILVEGGSKIFSYFLKEGIIDKVFLFYAPKLFGSGIKFLEGITLNEKLKYVNYKKIKEDFLVEGYLKEIFEVEK